MVENGTGRIMLIDFGVSKQYDPETGQSTTTTPVGVSHGYAPLEQYNNGGVSTFSPQSDIYALGATLLKMLTGTELKIPMIIKLLFYFCNAGIGIPLLRACVRRKYMRIFEQIFLQTRQKFAGILSYGKNF